MDENVLTLHRSDPADTKDGSISIRDLAEQIAAADNDLERREILTTYFPHWNERIGAELQLPLALQALHHAGYDPHTVADIAAISWLNADTVERKLKGQGFTPHVLPKPEHVAVPPSFVRALERASSVEGYTNALKDHYPQALRKFPYAINPYQIAAMRVMLQMGCPQRYAAFCFHREGLYLSRQFDQARKSVKIIPAQTLSDSQLEKALRDARRNKESIGVFRTILTQHCPGWDRNTGEILSANSRKALWALHAAGFAYPDMRTIFGKARGNIREQYKAWNLRHNHARPFFGI